MILLGAASLLPRLGPLSLSPHPAAGQFPGELQGRVLDAWTGEGVAGARVTLEGVPGAVRTEGDGSFRVRGLEAGTVRIGVAAPGYRPTEVPVRVRHGEVTRADLLLEPVLVELEPVQVTAARREGVRLDGEEIARSGARTVGELLAGLPGVVIRRRGPGGPEEVSLRGMGGDQVLVLLDGVAVNDPVTGTADLSLVPLTGVTEVEVLSGARGARYGPRALGGVVRIQTGRPRPTVDGAIRVGSLGEAGASGTLAGARGSLEGDLSFRLRRLDGGFPFQRGDFLGGGDGRRTNADLQGSSLHGGVGGGTAEGARWQLRAGMDHLSRGIPGKAFAPSDSARQAQDRAFVQGRLQGEAAGLSLDLTAHHLAQEVRFRDPAPPLGPPFHHRTRLRSTGAELEASSDPGTFGPLHWGGGLSVRRQALTSDQLREDGRVERLDLGAFVHAELPELPLPGRPGLSAAVRAHRDGASGEWHPAHDLTLRLPLGPVHLHAAHRSSFSPPSPGDQFFREGVGIAPNPDLRAERIPGEVEVGASVRARWRTVEGTLTGEVFRGDLEDMIVWAPDFRFIWSPRNVDVRRLGGQVQARLGHLPSGLRVGGHLAHTRVTRDRGRDAPRVQVAYRPRDTGSLHLGWDREPVHLEVRARYTGVRYPAAASVNALDPFWTVETVLSGEWAVGGWRVRPLLRVDRLLDERAPFIFAFPEPGRTFLLELRVAPGP